MRRRIWKISEDRFDDPKPTLLLSEDRIDRVGKVGRKLSGTFSFRTKDKEKARGIVYSTDPSVTLLTTDFEGSEVEIPYELKDLSFTAKDTIDGSFVIVYNRGEVRLPYHFTFREEGLIGPEGEIRDLKAYKDLAQSDPKEAQRLFYTKEFSRFIKDTAPDKVLVTMAYEGAAPSQQNFENYLAAAGFKERVRFQVKEERIERKDIEKDEEIGVHILRNTWGYIHIDVRTEGDFLTAGTPIVKEEDFLGREASVPVRIRRDKLHAGHNFGRITFTSQNTERTIEVRASYPGNEEEEKRALENRKTKELILKTWKTYFEFRLRRLPAADFRDQVKNAMDFLSERRVTEEEKKKGFLSGEISPWYRLITCFSYIRNKEERKALYLIRDLKTDIKDHYSPAWAFFLYLCCLMEPDEAYRDKCLFETEKILRLNPEDERVFLILLALRKEYKDDPARKVKDIRQWISSGHASSLLKLEVYLVYKSYPYLISSFDPFTLLILSWMRRFHAFDRNLSSQVLTVLKTTEPAWSNELLRILLECYRAFPDRDLLDEILSYLIRNEKVGARYLSLYRKGVREGSKVNGLYEAYLLSIPAGGGERIPREVLLYFQYPSEIPYEKRAALYAYIYRDRDRQGDIYRLYSEKIYDFAERQVRTGHLYEDLIPLYQNILDRGIYMKETAVPLSHLVFTRRVMVSSETFVRAVLYMGSMREPYLFPVRDHIAYLPVFDKDYLILFEDKAGNRQTGEGLYASEEILHTDRAMDHLREETDDPLPFLIHDFSSRDPLSFEKVDSALIRGLLSDERIRPGYLLGLIPSMLSSGQGPATEDLITSYLLKHPSLFSQSRSLRTAALDFAASLSPEEGGGGEKMAHLFSRFPYQGMKEGLLFSAAEGILTFEEKEGTADADDWLITLLAGLAYRGRSSEETLSFLLTSYTGPKEITKKIFDEARLLHLDTSGLAERSLIQLLYEDDNSSYPTDLFTAYMGRHPGKMVTEAFLTYWSREYILGHTDPDLSLFVGLLRQQGGESLNDSERIALMKYLCLSKDLTEEKERILFGLMAYYLSRGVCFSFYTSAPARIQSRFHLYDRTFITWQGKAWKKLFIDWTIKGHETQSEPLVEMYDGIYVKALILFTGETLDYRIYEEGEKDSPLYEGKRTGREAPYDASSFKDLDLIASDLSHGKADDALRKIKTIRKDAYLTKELFKTL